MDKFFDYFDSRHRDSILKKTSGEDGPVITISRQTGCDARQVAENVVDDLNKKMGGNKWKWVDKDVIYAIAKELNTDTQRVENFYKGIELSNMSEMIMAFSGGFVSDLRVKKAIKDVVLSMCKEGYIVLVGRGARRAGAAGVLHAPAALPVIRRLVRALSMRDARRIAQRALTMATAKQVEEYFLEQLTGLLAHLKVRIRL